MFTWLLTLLVVTVGTGRAQRSTQEAFMIQYFERRITQLEERLNKCEQNTQRVDQKMYDLSTEVRGQLARTDVNKAELKLQVDRVSMRVDRVERDVEYLENKIPNLPQIEVEQSLLEEQMRDAQLTQLKKAKITLGTACNTLLTGITSLKIVKKAGDAYGSWLKDPSKGSAKIYFFSGARNSTLLEFTSLKTFTEGGNSSSPRERPIRLPFPWQGSGHVIYNGFVYYHKADTTNQILKVHLLNRTVSDSMLLHGAGRLPVYALTPDTYVALAVDEMGLWAIHADPDFGGNLVMTKLDAGLAVEHIWDTACKSQDAEAAFVICGTLYVVYNSRYGGRSSVRCLYDIHDTVRGEEGAVLFFPKRYSSHTSIHYHPRDKHLYAWDDGYQAIYKVDTSKKTPVSSI